MKKNFFIVLLLLVKLGLFAENYYIDLSAEEMKIADFDYYVTNVIDASINKNCIGYFQSREENFLSLFFKRETEEELSTFFRKNLPNNASQKPLIVRVNKIFIHNNIASVSLTFFERTDLDYQELFTSCQVVDNKQAFKPNLVEALRQCFLLFKERNLTKRITPKIVSASALSENALLNASFPIVKEPQGEACLYETYSDFLYNTPDTSTGFKVRYNVSDSIQNVFANFRFLNEKEKKKIWGFWDGKKVYVKLNDEMYYPLTFEDGQYYIWCKPPLTANEKNDIGVGVGFATFSFGLIGASIALVIANEYANHKEDVKYYLDYTTSEFIYENKRPKFEARTLIYSSMYNRENTEIEVWINGFKQATITADSYYEWVSNADITQANVMLKSKNVTETISFRPQIFCTQVLTCKINKKDEIHTSWLPIIEKRELLARIKENKTKKVSSTQ